MPRREPEEPKQSVSLHIGSSFASAWENVLLTWFKSTALASLENEQPAAVVTPFPSTAAFLRSKLLEHEIPLLGVKFITPPHLRELLLAENASSLPLREHLRLLLAIAAESVANHDSKDVDPAAAAASAEEAVGNSTSSVAPPGMQIFSQTSQSARAESLTGETSIFAGGVISCIRRSSS